MFVNNQDDFPQGGEHPNNNNWGIEIIPHKEVLDRLLSNISQVDYYVKAKLEPGHQITSKHIIVISIDHIIETALKHRWSIRLVGGQLAVFNGAYWKILTKDEVKSFLGRAAIEMGNDPITSKHHKFKDELYQQFLSSSFIPKPLEKADEILINFQNGTLVVHPEGNSTFREFREADLLFYQLDFKYDPNAGTEKFNVFLDRVLPDLNQQMILAEFLGYIFVKNSLLKLEKSLILYGTGANGKSTLFEIIYSLLGKENISTFSLQNITGDTGYYRAKLINKLLNYATEISSKMDSSVFKALASGEPIEARLPYGEPFVMEDYAKLMFNTNELPKDVENNNAFFRRFIILEFSQTIPVEERDPKLASKIKVLELPGIFNWVIDGLKRLIAQEGFTKSEAAYKTLEEYRLQSDSAYLFLNEAGYSPGVTHEYALKEVYGDYKAYCLENGYKPCSNRVFKDRLKKYNYSLNRKSQGWCFWSI
jgi:putative DNA primase/helicase